MLDLRTSPLGPDHMTTVYMLALTSVKSAVLTDHIVPD